MTGNKGWSRRDFVQMIGTAALGSRALGATLFPSAKPSAEYVYVGSAGGSSDAIEVFAAMRGRLTQIQRVESKRPVAMALAANGRFLYAVNEISQYRGLPRGTIEAYAIGNDGRLDLINRQELSLAATRPSHVALSADGQRMVVTAQGGGVFNTLPVAKDGSVGRADGIFKVTGDADGRTAQPRMAIFDADGRVVSADAGTGRLRVLHTSDDALAAHSHIALAGDDAPRHIALHNDVKALYVARTGSIDRYRYDLEAGKVMDLQQSVQRGAHALALHPAGDLLLACDADRGITAWRIGSNGTLSDAGHHGKDLGRLDAISIARDGESLIAISGALGQISSARIDVETGRVNEVQTLAKIDSPRRVAVIYS
jgi:6-phosphogluconolactonase (cycloisomerase 2 family)